MIEIKYSYIIIYMNIFKNNTFEELVNVYKCYKKVL